MNISVTSWNISNIHTLGELQDILRSNSILVQEGIDWNDEPPKTEILNQEEFNINNTYQVSIENNIYEYVIFKSRVERAKSKKSWYDNNVLRDRELRVNVDECTFIAYKNQEQLKLVSFGSKSVSEKVVKYSFQQTGILDISKNQYNLIEDVFYWILHRIIEMPYLELAQGSGLKVCNLLSYLGKTEDGKNAMRGSGRSIEAILSTLACILSTDSLRAIRPEFQYNENIIVVELTLSNTFKICENNYSGIINVYRGQEKLNALAIYILDIIIPKIIENYNENISSNIWSKQRKKAFLNSIGTDLTTRINEILTSLDGEDEISIIQDIDETISEIDEDILQEDFDL